MSALVELSPHRFSPSTLQRMAQPPPNGWTGEHYPPRNGGYNPQRPPAQPRLPPMLNTVAGPSPGTLNVGGSVAPRYGDKSAYYYEQTTPSPIQQVSPQMASGTDPYVVAQRPDFTLSPSQSSTTSDRSSEDFQETMRQFRHRRDHAQTAASRTNHQVRYRLSPDRRPSLLQGKGSQAPPGPTTSPTQSIYSSAGSSTSQPTSSSQVNARSMSINNLLIDDGPPTSAGAPGRPASVPKPKPPIGYRLKVRQQPIAARCCGFGERDRRVIDPPPILQLIIEDPDASEDEIEQRMRYPYLVVHCSIFDESGRRDMTTMPEDFRAQKRLMGTLVSSPFVGFDEHGVEGCFFCFPDLSCRTSGIYRLKFVLVVLNPMASVKGEQPRIPIAADVLSDSFTVYNAKDFPGMKPSTSLTKRLKEQGCLISLKKGNERARTSRNRDDSPDEDDEDDDEVSPAKRSKKPKRD